MFSEKDTGTRRLLELGIRQKLRRPLHWTHSFMIALSILSPTTCITGKGSSSYQVLYYYSNVTLCALAAARKESLPTGLYSQGLIYGGPVVLVWGWVCAGSLHTLAAFSMSELSSAFPVSGGLYYWSFMLGGNHGPFASWMVGWINLLGQVCYITCCPPVTQSNSVCTYAIAHVQHTYEDHSFVTTPAAWAANGEKHHSALSAYLLLIVKHG